VKSRYRVSERFSTPNACSEHYKRRTIGLALLRLCGTRSEAIDGSAHQSHASSIESGSGDEHAYQSYASLMESGAGAATGAATSVDTKTTLL